MGALQGEFGCKLGAKRPQFPPKFIELPPPNHPVSHLECMAGTTGLEPATSAVTATSSLPTLPRPLPAANVLFGVLSLSALRKVVFEKAHSGTLLRFRNWANFLVDSGWGTKH